MNARKHAWTMSKTFVTRHFFWRRGIQLPAGCGVSARPGTGNWLMMPAKVVGIASEAGDVEVSGADTEAGCCCCCSCRWFSRADARVLRPEADGITSEAGDVEASEADTKTGCCCCCFRSCCSCRWLPRADARVLRPEADDAGVLLLLEARF